MKKNSINLLPKSFYDRLANDEKKSWISLWGFLAIFIVVVLSSILIIGDVLIANIYNGKLEESENLYKEQQRSIDVANKAASVKSRSRAITTVSDDSINFNGEVTKLLSLEPRSRVSFRNFNSIGERLEASAIANNLKDVAIFMNIIETTTNFKNPQLVSLFPLNTDVKDISSIEKKWQFTISIIPSKTNSNATTN